MSSKAKSAVLDVQGQQYHYYPLGQLDPSQVEKLPRSLKVLLENLLRHWNDQDVSQEDIAELSKGALKEPSTYEISYFPARVLMQDFTGVPGVVDLAAMRDAMKAMGKDPAKINPLAPVDLVIDHSVMVDFFGSPSAFEKNVDVEMERNGERYSFLKWGQGAFENFRVVPPGTGICHQVNLEYLSKTVWTKQEDGKTWAFPDTLVGTDSHTTMVNGLSVLGWGVGGIEAEAALLGQPVSMLIPQVVGFKLTGKLADGVTATDLVLTITELLRKQGVVGKFVEYFGDGLDSLSLSDRATISNMSPEYGATCGFFPIDAETLRYLKFTGRSEDSVELVEQYAKAQGLWRTAESDAKLKFSELIELDLSTVQASMAGPKRPQDRLNLDQVRTSFLDAVKSEVGRAEPVTVDVSGKDYKFQDGHVVIAAITSCTNTSNPSVMLAAGLVAQKANALGLKVKPWVKTSLAPGSQVVTDYLEKANLTEELNKLGFNLVGYGCTTCIGNSGPLETPLAEAVDKNNMVVAAVLSGNRNFEGRINPHVRANYLASPPLVVAYALAGTVNMDLSKDPIGTSKDGKDVYLRDIWPSSEEVARTVAESLNPEMFTSRYADVFKGPEQWQSIKVDEGTLFDWPEASTYIKKPSFFDGMTMDLPQLTDIEGARVLAVLGDSITTDHISPAGSIKADSPAGKWLQDAGVKVHDFNSFGSRRGNHEVMVRGTFGNIRIRNEMVPGKSGPWTRLMPDGAEVSIYDAAQEYMKNNIPTVVITGKEYGTGSSRDWAAKGTFLLGVKAVIAESFERIHRSNLVGMGVYPLEFAPGEGRKSLGLTGDEKISILGVADFKPKADVKVLIEYKDGSKKEITCRLRVDTAKEMEYIRHGGILQFVIRRLAQ